MHSSNQSLTKLARTAQPCIFEKKKSPVAPFDWGFKGALLFPTISFMENHTPEKCFNGLGDFLCP